MLQSQQQSLCYALIFYADSILKTLAEAQALQY